MTATGGKLDAPDPVERQVVGKAQVRFESCVSMTVDHAFDDGLSGRLKLQPVGPVAAECRLQDCCMGLRGLFFARHCSES